MSQALQTETDRLDVPSTTRPTVTQIYLHHGGAAHRPNTGQRGRARNTEKASSGLSLS